MQTLRSERLSDARLLRSRSGRDHCRRDRQLLGRQAAETAAKTFARRSGTFSQSPWIPVRILHPRIRHVHVHAAA